LKNVFQVFLNDKELYSKSGKQNKILKFFEFSNFFAKALANYFAKFF